jgi:hypothetical protein
MTRRSRLWGAVGMMGLLAALTLPRLLTGQEDPRKASAAPDVWKPLRPLEGTWLGSGQGTPGESTVERWYEFIMSGRFMHARNKATYKPQEKSPKGQNHEDWSLFSYDQARGKLILRQFHMEGFVNEYVLDSVSPDGKTLVFITERIENIAAGWRARETYHLLSDTEFEETFELAPAGKDFEVYSRSRLKRVR